MNHFLLIDEGSYDGSTVFGIYDTFEAAREDAERRTAAKAEVEAQATVAASLPHPAAEIWHPNHNYTLETR